MTQPVCAKLLVPMKYHRLIPYTVAAVCLTAGALLFAYAWLTTYTGEIRIAVGTAESIAVRPATFMPIFFGVGTERLAGSDIPFDTPTNARDWVHADRYYDVAALPFALAVGGSELIADRRVAGTLILNSEYGERRVDALPGTRVELAGAEYAVAAVRPWQGLVSAPGNPAMAALSIAHRGADSTPVLVFLPNDAWVRFDSETALHFAWVDSAAAAREMDAAARGSYPLARWGVVEDGRGDWLSAFRPGSGLVMQDGTAVVLIQRNDEFAGPNGPTSAIEVSIERPGETQQRRWIQANADPSDPPIRYEDLSRMPAAVHVSAWEPGLALIRVLRHGTVIAETVAESGSTWIEEHSGLDFRLESVLPAATAVRAEDSVLDEVVLVAPDRQLRVPEHEAVSQDGTAIRFVPEVTPARIRYTAATYQKGDAGPMAWQLGPEDKIIVAGWELSQHPARLTSRDSAVFQVRKLVPLSVWGGGVALSAVGVLLFFSRRERL